MIKFRDFDFEQFRAGEYGRQAVLHADCFDVLSSLPAGCADLILADPGEGFGDYDADVRRLYDLSLPVIGNGWLCIFVYTRMSDKWHKLFPLGWRLVSCPRAYVAVSNVVNCWGEDIRYDCQMIKDNTAFALLWSVGWPGTPADRGGAKFQRECLGTTLLEEQMLYLLRTLAGKHGLVIDPMLGTGTTLLAAKRLGLAALGIDQDKEMCYKSEERLGSIPDVELSLT